MQIMYIYEITNNLNGKTYIGQRHCPSNETPETDSKYMGSGINIRRAERKYGIENFSKQILAVCYNENVLNILEKSYILLNKEIGKAEYNIAAGGYGNTYTYKTEEELLEIKKKISKSLKGHKLTLEIKKKISKSLKGHKLTKESLEKMKQSKINYCWWNNGKVQILSDVCPEGFMKGRLKIGNCWNKGLKMNENFKKKISESHQGLKWWNNGIRSIMAKECPEGFVIGRLQFKTDSTKGFHWWNNGVINVSSKECPEGFVPGMLKRNS